MKLLKPVLLSALIISAPLAQAAPIFSDDFEGYGAATINNWIPPASSG